MISKENIIKAVLICVIIAAVQTLYAASSAFQDSFIADGETLTKIEALIEASKHIDIWSRMFNGWLYQFGLTFITCFLLLLWLKPKAPNK
ncbi:MAG: hypothetical protein KAT04_06565 [Methylococcales bacterium]|nr:hypothetical protein [Methylococcales bacterium]